MIARTLLRPGLLAAVACLAFTACSGSNDAGDAQDAPSSVAGTASAGSTTSTTVASGTAPADDGGPPGDDDGDGGLGASVPGPVSEDDLVRFIAAAEVALEGSVHEGAVYDAPETYIGIATGACARFTAGEGLKVVASDLVVGLSETDPTDVEQLVGAILGAATRTICPEHAGLI